MARQFYEETLRVLIEDGVPFVVGGALALKHFAGVARDTKDLDVFLRRSDLDRALDALSGAGFQTEKTFPHWLAKSWAGETFIDIIFDSANGVCPVDDDWFEHAAHCELWGHRVLVSPAEEMIVSKSFVMERERFDGADVMHLLYSQGAALDWGRVLRRFGPHWRVLLGHLVFFQFVYPQQRHVIPSGLLNTLLDRARDEQEPEDSAVCQGTLLSREQYLVDLRERGYADARTAPWGTISQQDINVWTDAIGAPK